LQTIKKYPLKGFTIPEMLVTLILTSMAVTMSYTALNYVQRLFAGYKIQNKFINEYTDFTERMNHEGLRAVYIVEQGVNHFTMMHDSNATSLDILENVILMKRLQRCDTFHVSARKIKKEYEEMKNQAWSNKVIKSIQFETEFTKQRFIFCLYKDYDASVKLKLDRED
jgi:prepilin-type N-terminal cleavage/methylation domain-containing protein